MHLIGTLVVNSIIRDDAIVHRGKNHFYDYFMGMQLSLIVAVAIVSVLGMVSCILGGLRYTDKTTAEEKIRVQTL